MSKKHKKEKIVEEVSPGILHLKGKTINQNNYLKAMEENDIVFGVGSAGTGKTVLATYYAINKIFDGSFKKIVITRPVVGVGEELGFLPGDIEEKIDPYIKPILQYINKILNNPQKTREWMNKYVSISPLAYMRGSTFDDAILILDEGQNTTKEQMFMFLTRIGENSKAIITADPSQIDIPKHLSSIHETIRRLSDKEKDKIKIVHFNDSDIIRSRIVRIIVQAFNKELK